MTAEKPPVFCTLFDGAYLSRGLALHRSLRRHCPDAELVAYCFDADAAAICREIEPAGLQVVDLGRLEADDPALRAVRSERTPVEYCWTATPAVVRHVLDARPDVEQVTYLDADLLFFADPRPLLGEMDGAEASVLITPHGYAPPYEHHAVNGVYNVQFMSFRADANGRRALDWWRERCLEWCHATPSDGRFGDQKYLDDWPERFPGVHVLRHPGAGLAPWNVLAHRVEADHGPITVDGEPLVFFHYHGLRLQSNGRTLLHPAGYHVPRATRRLLYPPYLDALAAARREIQRVRPGFDRDLASAPTAGVRISRARERCGEVVSRRAPVVRRLRYRRAA